MSPLLKSSSSILEAEASDHTFQPSKKTLKEVSSCMLVQKVNKALLRLKAKLEGNTRRQNVTIWLQVFLSQELHTPELAYG